VTTGDLYVKIGSDISAWSASLTDSSIGGSADANFGASFWNSVKLRVYFYAAVTLPAVEA